jgi:hypothetical protein
MRNYDYLAEMKDDVLNAIRDQYDLADYENRDDFEQVLNDELWIDDAVTGNTSGSYTSNSSQAREYVLDNMDLLKEALFEFGADAKTTADHFLNEDWEYFDVTIRCYLLGQAISEALDEIGDDEFAPEEETEEEEPEASAM